jgi:hypothetical protein
MSTLSAVLDSPAPAAEHADALMLYGQFVGSWEGEVTYHPPDAAPVRHSAEVHFGWVLQGRAVQDVWIVPARRDRQAPLGPQNLYGTTVRVYDPAAGAWNVTWMNPPNGAFTRLVGRREGDRIVQLGEDRDGLNRWIFQEITADSFRWTGELSADGGKTWRLAAEFALRRVGR